MAVKLGNTEASLYLGSTPVAAYLGAVQVYSAAATLYFDGAVDNDWATVGNWWLDAAGTEPAGRLPASVDSAVVLGAVYTSASPVVLASLTVSSSDEFYGQYTVLGSTSFTDNSVNFAQITGNATFNDTSTNGGTVTGNATFNDSSSNSSDGTVSGNATFNDSSQNYGNVTGTATFTGSACNDEGTAGTFVPDPPPSCP
jgi:hypothetical protein